MSSFADREKDRAALIAAWHEAGIYAKSPLSDFLLDAAAKEGLKPMHFWSESGLESCSIDELCRQGLTMATALVERGVRPGDVIGVQMPHCRELAVIYLAATLAGAVMLPMIHTLGPADVQFQLTRTNAKWYFFLRRWRKIDYAANLAQIARPDSLKHCVAVDRAPENDPVGTNDLRLERWDDLARGARVNTALPQLHGDDVVAILFTSGSTAEPKGAQHTHNTVRAIVKAPFMHNYGSFLCAFPAGHMAGFATFFWSLLGNIEMAFIDHWHPGAAASLVERFGLQQIVAVPLTLEQMLAEADATNIDVSSLKVCLLGATSISKDAIERLEARGIRGMKGYGSTEYARVSQSHWDMPLALRTLTDGKIQEDTEVRIMDDSGKDLPLGEDGEIVIRGPQLLLGYLDNAHNKNSFLSGGWFKTGDIGRLNAEGFITITDRKKDIIIRGGENISSKEIEGILESHPDIAEAAAVGYPDAVYGERVCAVLAMRPGTSLTIEDLRDYFATHGVAKFKTPERIVFVDTLPRTTTGKTKKEVLRAQLRGV